MKQPLRSRFRGGKPRVCGQTGARLPGFSMSLARWTTLRKPGWCRKSRFSTSFPPVGMTWPRYSSARTSRTGTMPFAAIIAPDRFCCPSACRWKRRWPGRWPAQAATATGAISAWCSTIPMRTAPAPCRCAGASARSTHLRPAGRRRLNTDALCWARLIMKARSALRLAATLRWPPMDSGRR